MRTIKVIKANQVMPVKRLTRSEMRSKPSDMQRATNWVSETLESLKTREMEYRKMAFESLGREVVSMK